jgi:hypothetical protein
VGFIVEIIVPFVLDPLEFVRSIRNLVSQRFIYSALLLPTPGVAERKSNGGNAQVAVILKVKNKRTQRRYRYRYILLSAATQFYPEEMFESHSTDKPEEAKPNCLVFELKGSSGFLPAEDSSIEVGNRLQWKQIRKHFDKAIESKLTRFNVVPKERRNEILRERCNVEHWDWSVSPYIAKQMLLNARVPTIKWALSARIRHTWWWDRMENTYMEDYLPVVDELAASFNHDDVLLPPKSERFWNAETIKEESAKIGLIPRSQIWICITLFNHQRKVKYVQLAHKTIDKEFHDNINKQHELESELDRTFPLEEQFIVAEPEYPSAPKLRDHELQAVFAAIDELVAQINDPANDQWCVSEDRILYRDIFRKDIPEAARGVCDEYGAPHSDYEVPNTSDFI